MAKNAAKNVVQVRAGPARREEVAAALLERDRREGPVLLVSMGSYCLVMSAALMVTGSATNMPQDHLETDARFFYYTHLF